MYIRRACLCAAFALSIPTLSHAEDDATRVTRNEIQISGEVRFNSGSAEIQAASHALLNEIAAVLLDNPDLPPVRIAGHTDDVGDAEANKRLSARRAEAVKSYLISRGVPADRLESVGYGESRPIALGKSKEARSKNRRVEFVLNRPLSVSADAGFNLSTASGVDGFRGTGGMTTGSTTSYVVMDGLTANVGARFSQRGAKSDTTTLKVSFIDVPISATYSRLPPLGPIAPSVGAGVMLSFPVAATVNGEATETGSMQTSFIADVGVDYGISIGTLSGDIRYARAFSGASPGFADLKLGMLSFVGSLAF